MKNWNFPIFHTANRAIKSFSFIEKVIFYTFVALLLLSTLIIVGILNNKILVTTPAHGGNITEGIVGFPSFGNPVLAFFDTDYDITGLVYAGLMKATPDGSIVPELATAQPNISEDGLSYTFTIREDATFHDGTPVTADDVVFTISRIKDPIVKSPRRINWEGVRVEKVDERTVRFSLGQAYQPFLENTTIGILPNHIWGSIPPEQMLFSSHNIEPIGAGPFSIARTTRNDDGIVTRYTLEAFSDYALGKPYVDTITLRFYNNESELIEAFNNGEINALHGVNTSSLEELDTKPAKLHAQPLSRVFGVFFNQNQADVFTDLSVRRALSLAVNRSVIVDHVLGGYGMPIDGPLPPELVNGISSRVENPYGNAARARAMLEEGGWERGEDGIYSDEDGVRLSFTLTTANTPELRQTAELLKSQWEQIGAEARLELFDVGVLTNEVIRPREYDALLFGLIVGRNSDLFPFWHSSQRNDPGLNIALYANITVDDILEDVRVTFDDDERRELLSQFTQEIAQDNPAIFLYTPAFTYLIDKNVKDIDLGTIVTPADRFLNVHTWFINTERLWNIFIK